MQKFKQKRRVGEAVASVKVTEVLETKEKTHQCTMSTEKEFINKIKTH